MLIRLNNYNYKNEVIRMNKRIDRLATGIAGKKLITLNDVAALCSCGLSTARKIGQESGARVTFGKTVLYKTELIDRYITAKTG